MPDSYTKDFFKYAHRTFAKRWVDDFTNEAIKRAEENPMMTSFSKEIYAHEMILDFIKFIMAHKFMDLFVEVKKEDTEGGGYYNAIVTIDWS